MKKYIVARWIGGKFIIYKIIDNTNKEVIAECKEAKWAHKIVSALNHISKDVCQDG